MSETEIQEDIILVNDDDLDAFTTDFFGEKEVADNSAAKPEDAEQEVANEEVKSEDEPQKDDLSDEDEAEAEIELAKPKSKVQERIDELVKQKHDADRQAKADMDTLRKEFEDKIAALTPKQTTVAKSAEPDPDDLFEDGNQKYPLGEFDPLYIKDLTRYTLESERAAVRIAEEQERTQRELLEAKTTLHNGWTEKLEPTKAKYPDFEEKSQKLLDGFGGLDQGYSDYLSTVLMTMDYGPDVLYYLSNHPDEATKIVNSGAQRATIALGRIEAKFVDVDAEKQLAKPKLSKAPPPPAATARGTGGGAKSVEGDTDDLDAFTAKFFEGKRRT